MIESKEKKQRELDSQRLNLENNFTILQQENQTLNEFLEQKNN